MSSQLKKKNALSTKMFYILKYVKINMVINFYVMRMSDRWFDKRYGTDTWHQYELNKKYTKFNPYSTYPNNSKTQPSLIALFQNLMRNITIPENSVFLDVGCGTGLITLLASTYRFKKIIGIEISKELCAIARKNDKIFKKTFKNSTEISIITTDARRYQIPDDINFIYCFNPFNDIVLFKFISNLVKSYKSKPRKITFFYVNPVYRHVIEYFHIFKEKKESSFRSIGNLIYST
ncbi:MAG: hypothetical protein RBG13Loki_1093 [Promethearchaeota archaeon CR_4]|nr:MAG: hypothetical protein RBG13Loki_1093 [Candidatus Lokiarchaeota archaeon CR_4]